MKMLIKHSKVILEQLIAEISVKRFAEFENAM